jgi:hypothetical protein
MYRRVSSRTGRSSKSEPIHHIYMPWRMQGKRCESNPGDSCVVATQMMQHMRFTTHVSTAAHAPPNDIKDRSLLEIGTYSPYLHAMAHAGEAL